VNTESPEVVPNPVTGADVAMEVLRSHVPLTLLMDIGSAEGPDSAGIAAIEGGDADWLQRAEG
jgi:hypothetical protein